MAGACRERLEGFMELFVVFWCDWLEFSKHFGFLDKKIDLFVNFYDFLKIEFFCIFD